MSGELCAVDGASLLLLRDPCNINCLVALVDQGVWRHHAAMLLSGGVFAEELPRMDPCNGSGPATGNIDLHILKAPRMAPRTPTVCPELATYVAVIVEAHDGIHGRRAAWHRRQCVGRHHDRRRLEALGDYGGGQLPSNANMPSPPRSDSSSHSATETPAAFFKTSSKATAERSPEETIACTMSKFPKDNNDK